MHSHEPIVELLRSRVFFDWFDTAGVEDIPAVFVGEIVDSFVVWLPPGPSALGAPGVVVAAIASVDDVSTLTAGNGSALDRFTAGGIRKTWVFRTVGRECVAAKADIGAASVALRVHTGEPPDFGYEPTSR